MTNDKEKEQREELKHRFVEFLERHPTAFPSPEEIEALVVAADEMAKAMTFQELGMLYEKYNQLKKEQ